jgi:hypothetical protein
MTAFMEVTQPASDLFLFDEGSQVGAAQLQ